MSHDLKFWSFSRWTLCTLVRRFGRITSIEWSTILPPLAELVDPSSLLLGNLGARLGDLSPWLDPRPLGWGALAGKAEIFGRPSPPFWLKGARLPTSWGTSGSLFCWKRTNGVLFRTILMDRSLCTYCMYIHIFIYFIVKIIWLVEVIAMVGCT